MPCYRYGQFTFTSDELETWFMNTFRTMKQNDVLQLVARDSAAYDPSFEAKYKVVTGHHLFGFDPSWNPPRAYCGGSCIHNGPILDTDSRAYQP